MSPKKIRAAAISPGSTARCSKTSAPTARRDGKHVVAALDDRLHLVPVGGGAPLPIAGVEPGEKPRGFSAAGSSLYVQGSGPPPARVYRVDLQTGQRELHREVSPADLAGVVDAPAIYPIGDGSAYVYTYRRILDDLFVAEGLE